MTQAAHAPAAVRPSLRDRHHFLLRRLHSLTGVVPIGVFVIFHLFTNAQMAWLSLGFDDAFQHEIEFIHNLPALLFIEIFGLWLPIAFHAGLGVAYTFTGRPNNMAYGYADNWRYTFQRITGIIALLFIVYHVGTLRWGWEFLGPKFYLMGIDSVTGEATYPLAHATTAMKLQSGPLGGLLVLAIYIVGVYSAVFHWVNGLWTAAITWGLTVSVSAQRRWGYLCALLGVALAVFAAAALWSAYTYDVTPEDLEALRLYIEASAAGEIPH